MKLLFVNLLHYYIFQFSEMLLDMSVTEVMDYEDDKAELKLNPQTRTTSEICRDIPESDDLPQNPNRDTDLNDLPTSSRSTVLSSDSSCKRYSSRKRTTCTIKSGMVSTERGNISDKSDDVNQVKVNGAAKQRHKLKEKIGKKTGETSYGVAQKMLERRALDWVEEKQQDGESIKSSELSGVANSLAKELGIETFTASETWLAQFRRKYNVKFERKYVKQRQRRNNDFKLKAVLLAEEIGNTAAGREYNVNERQIREWRKQKEKLQQHLEKKSLGPGRARFWPDLESKLRVWMLKEEENGKDVTLHEIGSKAKQMAKEMGLDGFTGSVAWLARFRRRSRKECKDQAAGCDAKWTEFSSRLLHWVREEQKTREAIDLCDMRAQAKQIAGEMNIKDFIPSFLWLNEFSTKNNIKCKTKPLVSSRKVSRDHVENKFKVTVVECAEKIGNRGAERKYGINESLIRGWRKSKDLLKKFPEKKRIPGTGRQSAWPELECMLSAWLQKQQEDGNMISVPDIQTEAVRLAKLMNIKGFAGSVSWVMRYIKRKQPQCVKKRASYQDDTKLSIIDYAERFGRPAASRKYGITVNLLGEWCRNKEWIRQKLERKRNKHKSSTDKLK